MATFTRLRKRRPARPGFTLVELLIVISIIAVLASLSVAAVMKALNYQQRRNTQTLISKLDDGFVKHWRAVVETAKKENVPIVNPWAMTVANGNMDLARVIHVKCRLRQEFPTSFAEALNPFPLAPLPSYARILKNAQPNARSWQAESSACLYMALKEKRRAGDFDPDTSLSGQEVIDPIGDGLKEIHDAWGNPIVFSRFPVVCQTTPAAALNDMAAIQHTTNPNGMLGTPPSHDLVDPDSLLTNAVWVKAFGPTYAQFMHPVAASANYNLTPVIMSMGSHGLIFDPLNPSPLGNDDIYNIQLTPLNQ